MDRKRIAIYGGSFNPPTLAHVEIVRHILSVCCFDQFLVVPTFEHAYGKDLAPFPDRFEMCTQAFAGLDPCVRISSLDEVIVSKPRGSMFSMCTQFMCTQAIVDAPAELCLVVGQDQAEEIEDKWHEGAKLLELVRLFIVPRANKPLNQLKFQQGGKHFVLDRINPNIQHISSTSARAAIAAGADTSELIDTAVARCCVERNLYRG